MNRHVLFALLCLGVIVRSSPAQDYLRSQLEWNDRTRTTDDRDRLRRRYQDPFELERTSDRDRTATDRLSAPRFVTFYRDRDRPSARYSNLDGRRGVNAPYPNQESDQLLVANRYAEARYPEARYVVRGKRYPVQQSNYLRPVHPSSRTSYHRSEFSRPPRVSHAPSWPAHPTRGRTCPPCSHRPATPPGTYVADGIIGQPVLYTNGQPVRNLFRAFGL